MAAPPIIGTSGQYGNDRGNPRHSRTTAGQGNQNIVNAVSTAYLLQDIDASATGQVRFVDPATGAIDTVMTPILAKNISRAKFTKSSICTYFRLPGITTPLLLVGTPNNPVIKRVLPPGMTAPTDFISLGELISNTTYTLTTFTGPIPGLRLSFSDPDPGQAATGIYTIEFDNGFETGDVAFVITPGNSGITDISNPPNTYALTGTLAQINTLFQGTTTGTVTTTITPGVIHTLTITITAPDGRSSIATYHVYGEESSSTFITTNQNIFVRTTGSDITGDGSSGNPFLTVARAFGAITPWTIADDVSVTITVGDGAFPGSTLTFDHPNGNRVTLTAENMPTTTVSSIQSSSGAAGAWSIILNVASIANIAVGDHIMLRSPTGGTLPTYLAGCHEVTARDVTNTRITVASKHLNATAPSGSVTGTIEILKTRLTFASGDGIFIGPGITLGLMTKLALVGSAGVTNGVTVESGQLAMTNCGIVNWGTGVFARRTGFILYDGNCVSGCAVRGVFGFMGGEIDNVSSACVTSGCVTGLLTTYSGGLRHDAGIVTGCNLGAFAGTAGSIRLSSAKVTGCTGNGMQASFAGTIYAETVTADRNATGISSDSGGTVYAASATITNNTSFGVFAITSSVITITSVTFSGNGTDSNALYDTIQRDGANIILSSLTGPEHGIYYDRELTSDQVASNAQNQDSGLTFPVVAGEGWTVELYGFIEGNNTTGDAAINIVTTGTWTTTISNWSGVTYNATAALVTTSATAFASSTNMVANPGQTANNGDSVARPFRIVAQFDALTSGNVKVQFGVVATGAGRTATLHAGTRLIARRVRS